VTPLGIFARTFTRPDLPAVLDAVAATGLDLLQFNLALAGGPSLPEAIPPALATRVRAEVDARGLRMAAVSGTYNMAHPDARARAAGLRRLGVLIAAAPALGTRVVTLCTGSRDPADPWRRHPDNATAEAWRDARASIAAALAVAEAHDVVLAIEPERHNVVASAPAARRLLDELRSPQLKVVLDAANLFTGPDLDGQASILEEAFELLGGDLALAHAKDVRRDGSVVAAGRGELDYPHLLALLAHAGPAIPLILHGLDEDEVAASVAFLRAGGGYDAR
jgi:sugar phosphate isomerase/epimerase